MKKTLYIICVAGLISSACSKSQNGVAEDQFCFDPAVRTEATKADASATEFPADDSFEVDAFLLDNNVPSILMTGLTVSKNESGQWKINGDRKYYWPKSGILSFSCQHPTTAEMNASKVFTDSKKMGVAANGENTMAYYWHNYTIKHVDALGDYITDNNLKTEENLALSKQDFMVAVTSINIPDRTPGDPVPVAFGHNLAKICFNIKGARDFTNQSVQDDGTILRNTVDLKINEIVLQNIYSVGTYKNIAPNWDDNKLSTDDLYSYFVMKRPTNGGNSAEYEDGEIGNRTPKSTPVLGLDSNPLFMYAIPQRLHQTAKINIGYSITQTTQRLAADGTTVLNTLSNPTENINKTLPINNVVPVWAMGACITYTLTVDLNDIIVHADYTAWHVGDYTEPVIR